MTRTRSIPTTILAIAAMTLAALAAGPAAAGPAQTARAAEPQAFHEDGVARWGADFRRFAIASGKAQDCAAACAAEDQCRSWTFVKAGIEGPQAQCRLKSAVPYAANDPCCVSGIAAGASVGLLAGYEGVETVTPKAMAAKGEAPIKTIEADAFAQGEGITASIRPRQRAVATAKPMTLMPNTWHDAD